MPADTELRVSDPELLARVVQGLRRCSRVGRIAPNEASALLDEIYSFEEAQL